MSTSVDSRVVQLEFDNNDFKTKVRDTLSDLAQLSDLFTKGVDIKGLERAAAVSNNMKLDGISSAVDEVNDKFSLLGVLTLKVFDRIADAAINLGHTITNALAIEPVRQGFGEYELEIGSVQTIIASTGESMKTVYGYLDDLNEYADKTIYSFSDMTKNIGKFTNAGVNLDRAVAAIKGIANEAALSGANSDQASHAMYNFAQALSAGSVKLVDWKSIEIATLGTKAFKQQLIDTAVALGTLNKTEEGYVSTTTNAQGSVSDAFTATKLFNESLNHQWMTTDVLVETLSHYSTDVREMTNAEKKAYEERLRGLGFTEEQIAQIEKLGKKAFDAAQDVKSFTQLVDTLKEAAGSGWTKTWKLIFGDLKEAKKLWTGVNNVVSKFVDSVSDYRNEALQYWHDAGGRSDVLAGLANVFEYLGKLVVPVQYAFESIFGTITSQAVGEKLTELSAGFKQWSEGLTVTNELASMITNTFRGLFSALKSVGVVLSGVFDGAMSVLVPLLTTIGEIVGLSVRVIGKFIATLLSADDPVAAVADAFRRAGSFIGDFVTGLRSGLPDINAFDGIIAAVTDKIKSLGAGVQEVVKEFSPFIGETLAGLNKGLAEFAGNWGFKDVLGVFMNLGAVAGSAEFVSLILIVKDAIENFDVSGLKKVSGVLDEVRESLIVWQTQLKAMTLLEISAALALMAGSLLLLSFIDPAQVAAGTAAVSFLLIMLSSAVHSLAGLGKDLIAVAAAAPAIAAFGIAMLGIAGAVAILGSLDTVSMLKGVAAITVMFGVLAASVRVMASASPKVLLASVAVSVLTVALIPLIGAIAALGAMDLGSVAQGVLALGAIMGVLSLSMLALSKISPKALVASAALVGISAAVLVLTASLAVLSKIPGKQLETALLALGAGLGGLALALNLMKGAIGGSAALLVAASAITVLTPALVALSSVPLEQVCVALFALGGSMAVLGAGAMLLQPAMKPLVKLSASLVAFSGSIAALGAGLGVFAIGLGLLVPPLLVLSSMPLASLGQALLAVVGVFAVLGSAAKLLASTVPSIVGISIALGLFGIALEILVPSLMDLSKVPLEDLVRGLVGLGLAMGVIGAVSFALSSITAQISGFAVSMAIASLGALAFSVALLGITLAVSEMLRILPEAATHAVELGTTLGTVIVAALNQIVAAIKTSGPAFIDAFQTLVFAMLDSVQQTVPKLIETGWVLIESFISSLLQHLSELIAAGVTIVISFIQGITQAAPQLAQSGFELVISFINSTADAIRQNHQAMYDAAWNLFTAILEALADLVDDILGGIGDLGNQAVDAVTGWWDSLWNAGHDDGAAIKDGVDDGSSGTDDVISDNLDAAKDTIKDAEKDFERGGGNLGDAFLTGSQVSMDPYTGEIVNTVSGTIDAVNGMAGAAGTVGSNVGSSLGKSATNATGATASGMRGKVQAAVDSAGSVSSSAEGKQVGAEFGAGMVSGVGSYVNSIAQEAARLVEAAKTAARNAQHSKSPSRDTMKYGRWFGEGYAIGIDRMVGDVVYASSSMVEAAKDELADSSTYLSSVLDFTEGISDTPVIRPVLDISSIRDGMSDISYLLAQRQVVSAGYVASKHAMAVNQSSGAFGGSSNSQYNFYLQYDAGTDATEMVREMTVAVRQSSLSEGA